MGASIGDLVVSIAGDIAKLEVAMGRAEYLTAQTAKKIDQAMSIANSAIIGLASGIVTFKTVDAFTKNIGDATEFAASMHDAAQKVGTTASELSSFKVLADQSGTSLQTVGAGLKNLSKSMLETAQGTGKAREVYKSLNLTVLDGNGQLKKGSDFMLEVAGSLSKMENRTLAVAYANKIMKGSGSELLPFLTEYARAGKQQALVTDEQAAAADRLKDAEVELQAVRLQFYTTISQQLIPVQEAYVRTLIEMATATDGMNAKAADMAAQNQIRQWAIDAGIGIAMVIDGFRYVVAGVRSIGEAIAVVAVFFVESFRNIGTVVGVVSASLGDFAQLLSGIGLILSGQFAQGAAMVKDAWDKIGGGAGQIADRFKESFTNITSAAEGFFAGFEGRATEFASGSVTGKFLDNLAKIGSGFKKVGQEATTTTNIIGKFKTDAVDKLAISLAKETAILGLNLRHLQQFGTETKATAGAEVELQLATMALNPELAESVARMRDRILAMARQKDELTISIGLEKEYRSALDAHNKALAASVQGIVDQIEQMRVQNATIGMTADQVTRYTVTQLEAKMALAQMTEGGEHVARAYQLQIDKLKELANLQQTGAGLKTMVDMMSGLAGYAEGFARALMSENGVAGALDYVSNLVKQLIIDMIALTAKKWFLQIVAGATGSGALSVAAGQVGSGTTAGSILSYAGTALSGYSTLAGSGGMAGTLGAAGEFYTGITTGAQVYAPGTAGYYGAAANTAAGGSTGAAGAAVTVAWIAAVVAAMYANNEMYSAGWRRPNDSTDSNPLTAVQQGGPLMGASYSADAIFRSLGFNNRWASVLSGSSMNTRLFGHQQRGLDAFGVSGSIGGSGVTGTNWQDWSERGGVFRSDRRGTDLSPFAEGQEEFFSTFSARLADVSNSFGDLLGVNAATVLAGFSHDFSLQLNDLDDAQIGTLLTDLFGSVLQEQVALVFDAAGNERVAGYVRELTGSGEEVTAMIQELGIMMTSLAQMDLTGLDINALMDWQREGETIGQAFERVAGGWVQLVGAFTSGESKLGQAEQQLRDLYLSLEESGYQMPINRDHWLDVMSALDLSTEAGRELWERMMALAPAFDAVTSAAEAAMKEFDDLMGRLRPGYTGQMQGLQMQSWVGQFQGANAWSSGLTSTQLIEQLRTITREDFAGYSASNQALILSILGLDETMMSAGTDIAAGIMGVLRGASSGPSTGYGAIVDALIGNVDTLVGAGTGMGGSALGNLFTEKGIIDEEWGAMFTRLQELASPTADGIPLYQTSNALRDEFIGLEVAMRILGDRMHGADGVLADIARLNTLMGEYGEETGAALFELEEWYEAQSVILGDSVAGMLALDEEYARRRQEILEGGLDAMTGAAEAAREKLRAWLDSLALSATLSPLSPEEKFDEARNQYMRVLGLAQGGDVGAMGDLQGAAETYLEFARLMFGSSNDYTAIWRAVRGEVGGVANPAPDPLLAVLPPASTTIASEAGLTALNVRVAELTTVVADGLTVADPKVRQLLEELLARLKNTANQPGGL